MYTMYLVMLRQYPYLVLFAKIFAFSAIVFPLVSVVIDYLTGDLDTPQSYLMEGLFFGVFFSGSMVAMTAYQLEDVKKDITVDDLKVVQKRTIISSLSPEECSNKIAGLFKADSNRSSGNQYLIRVPMSWQSFGEKIEVAFEEKDDQYRYHITSRPLVRWTISDGGKNLENVLKIEDALVA